ncbi:MAG: chorismate synthase, partial [Candidatus Methylomirabilis sp.]|nr:chorismate synthase [Deltaproteobacteria bacterium]
KAVERSAARMWDPKTEAKVVAEIEAARGRGDSLGGVYEIHVTGLPPGLGSHVQWDRKLDGRLAQALMSVQAVKGVEVGIGFEAARRPGSRVHDEIVYSKAKGYRRRTNRAGGTEGGMTTGETLVVRAAMKPISTLYKPLESVDMKTHGKFKAAVERSDICAVPRAVPIGEAVAAFVVADAFLEKFGGDSLREVRRNYEGYLAQVRER